MDVFAYFIYACIAIVALVIGVMILAFIWLVAGGLHMTGQAQSVETPPTD